MKYKIGKLLLWHVIVYMVFSLQADLLDSFNLYEAFDWLFGFKDFVLFITTIIAFFAYSFFSYSILFKFYDRMNNLLLALLMLIGLLIGIGFRFVLQEVVQKAIFGFGNYYNYTLKSYILDNLYYAFIFTAFGIIFYFIQNSKHKEVQRKELVVEHKKTELAFLRLQINPHFLFNTLNNIYTLIYQKSDASLFAVERLTKLLRYAIYEKEDKVPLSKEIQSVEDLIALQKLRYAYEPNLQIELEEGNDHLKVPPFLLMPFVENGFKHGNLKNPAQPMEIRLSKKGDNLVFYSKNEIAQQNKDQLGGVGLENIKRRLELIYGSQHTLASNNNGKTFEVNLKIPISLC